MHVVLILLWNLSFSHTKVTLLGGCMDIVVVSTMAGSLYEWGYNVMSLEGTELLVEWFKVYNVEILR